GFAREQRKRIPEAIQSNFCSLLEKGRLIIKNLTEIAKIKNTVMSPMTLGEMQEARTYHVLR
ncbi:MAG: hypothetical protein LHW64_10360, partial [Candidatus Cloacimonetes bacterium]|nr:hypothetical protein [Candidatus Cloacimonadota bacterium]MDY0230513.1 hypothetical protein [Candidatus Cloacimonadaceae bacterium]